MIDTDLMNNLEDGTSVFEQEMTISGKTGTGLIFAANKKSDALTLTELSNMFLESLWAMGYSYVTEVEVHCDTCNTHGSTI